MIGTKCPGQDMRYWTAEDVHEEECPHCGELIEFFKTDIRLRCRNCKKRVANPRFNMGCAQWCAYAEQCLGPAARGLKTKSLKLVMEEELVLLAKEFPAEIEKVKEMISRAEEKCQEQQIDMLPVIAAIIIISLKNLGLLDNVDKYLESLNQKHTLPHAALEELKAVVEEVLKGEIKGEMARIVVELID
jgi:hypothetical protein